MTELPLLEEYRAYVLNQIINATIQPKPFYHLYIEEILPSELYQSLKTNAYRYRTETRLGYRQQDNPAFCNPKYNLINNQDQATQYFTSIFNHHSIKWALFTKFYDQPLKSVCDGLEIHKEFEYVYTQKDRFQNIHVDIPAKFLSLVFYFPEVALNAQEAEMNSTVLYDKNLKPHYGAKFVDNSVCVFVPHFYSYHGFSTTVDRTALVMFYVNKTWSKKYKQRPAKNMTEEINYFKQLIHDKLKQIPLLEYQDLDLIEEMNQCLVNAKNGRVLLNG